MSWLMTGLFLSVLTQQLDVTRQKRLRSHYHKDNRSCRCFTAQVCVCVTDDDTMCVCVCVCRKHTPVLQHNTCMYVQVSVFVRHRRGKKARMSVSFSYKKRITGTHTHTQQQQCNSVAMRSTSSCISRTYVAHLHKHFNNQSAGLSFLCTHTYTHPCKMHCGHAAVTDGRAE